MSQTARKRIAEGKTKIVWEAENGEVVIESKDDITAGDGARHDVIEGKAEIAGITTSNVFEYLNAAGVATHFIAPIDKRSFRARNMRMIPLELVARRIATGSYLKRRPNTEEGTVFGELVVEFFEKDDANHDPLVIFDFVGARLLRYVASLPLSEGFMREQALADTPFAALAAADLATLKGLTTAVFTLLEKAWQKQDVTLVDIKIECGYDATTGELLVADVIDNDSWRIWPGGDKAQMKDKQVYRNLAGALDPAAKAKELGKIKQNFAWVAQETAKFKSGV